MQLYTKRLLNILHIYPWMEVEKLLSFGATNKVQKHIILYYKQARRQQPVVSGSLHINDCYFDGMCFAFISRHRIWQAWFSVKPKTQQTEARQMMENSRKENDTNFYLCNRVYTESKEKGVPQFRLYAIVSGRRKNEPFWRYLGWWWWW